MKIHVTVPKVRFHGLTVPSSVIVASTLDFNRVKVLLCFYVQRAINNVPYHCSSDNSKLKLVIPQTPQSQG